MSGFLHITGRDKTTMAKKRPEVETMNTQQQARMRLTTTEVLWSEVVGRCDLERRRYIIHVVTVSDYKGPSTPASCRINKLKATSRPILAVFRQQIKKLNSWTIQQKNARDWRKRQADFIGATSCLLLCRVAFNFFSSTWCFQHVASTNCWCGRVLTVRSLPLAGGETAQFLLSTCTPNQHHTSDRQSTVHLSHVHIATTELN